MGDGPEQTQLQGATGPIPGSCNIHDEIRDGIRVAERAVDLEGRQLG